MRDPCNSDLKSIKEDVKSMREKIYGNGDDRDCLIVRITILEQKVKENRENFSKRLAIWGSILITFEIIITVYILALD